MKNNHKNHSKLEETKPLVMDEIYEKPEKPKKAKKTKKSDDENFNPNEPHLTLKDFEYAFYKQDLRDGVYEKVEQARKNLKNIPSEGHFKDSESWKTRTTDWEFENDCDYQCAFTRSERWAALELTDYPRFEIDVIYENRSFLTRYFAPNIVLGAILDCMLKKPVSCYLISNPDYYFTNEILDKSLKELYEKGINFNKIYVSRTCIFFSRLFIFFGCFTSPPFDEIPKTHNLEEDIANEALGSYGSNQIFTKKQMLAEEEEKRQTTKKRIEYYQRIHRRKYTKSITTQTNEY